MSAIDDARDTVQIAALTWTPEDVRRLAALIALGPPSMLHASGTTTAPIRDERAACDADTTARADALHLWRVIGARAGVPLPKPGAM